MKESGQAEILVVYGHADIARSHDLAVALTNRTHGARFDRTTQRNFAQTGAIEAGVERARGQELREPNVVKLAIGHSADETTYQQRALMHGQALADIGIAIETSQRQAGTTESYIDHTIKMESQQRKFAGLVGAGGNEQIPLELHHVLDGFTEVTGNRMHYAATDSERRVQRAIGGQSCQRKVRVTLPDVATKNDAAVAQQHRAVGFGPTGIEHDRRCATCSERRVELVIG